MRPPLAIDTAIIGAGPAGCAAAIELARAGRSVHVFDKASFPRDKSCGDGLTTGALRRLERLGLHPSSVASFHRVHELACRSSSGRLAQISLDHGQGSFGAVARRRDLDAALVDLAREAGAIVHEGVGLENISSHQDNLELSFEDGESLHVGRVIAADGAWSPTRRGLGVADRVAAPSGQGLPDWYAFRAYVRGVAREHSERLWIWFDRVTLPGYAWLFPLGNGEANLGLFLDRRAFPSGASMQTAWRSVLDGTFLASLLGEHASFEQAPRAWPIPSNISKTTLSAVNGQVLFVGDAAHAADPFSGEGIAQALETGVVAAQAVLGSGNDSQKAAARYSRSIAATLGRDHVVARLSSSLIALPGAERLVVAACAGSTRLSRAVGRWLFEDYPRSMLISPGQWRHGLRSQPGAYIDQIEP